MSDSQGQARVQDRGDHLRITLDNPARRNALSPSMHPVLREALDRAAAENRLGAVVLTGAQGYFCAGGDLNALAQRAALSRDERRARIDELHATIRAIRACPRPVIAAVEGGAAGAGLSIALACDLLVAAEDAVFAAAYVRVGLVPDGGLTASLARRVPASFAARMCLTGDPVAAPVLAAMGVVTDLAAPGQAIARASEQATRLAQGPAGAQAAIKRLLEDAGQARFDDQLDRERDAMADALATPEAAAGLKARLERSTPDFGRGRPQPEGRTGKEDTHR
ncbi:oxepin-CoA hydrolase, alternative type [Paracoccus siganidrum]|uniref:Enoyl-CoA hydratase n=1 Tax=Paracoccus siganidrum TaxID=1276757 RepID=A0A419A5X1_9RHOB|nr:enoyl-CoA hydratase family protein [Paracoccus siganidrum]RJL13087.1 enoyl-CoA hydratase [Paracoccus siganidrum]RMC33043.1 enoyl-CoA hydratase [Paracoccus siganidrum]